MFSNVPGLMQAKPSVRGGLQIEPLGKMAYGQPDGLLTLAPSSRLRPETLFKVLDSPRALNDP
jgi:hypothetical protein